MRKTVRTLETGEQTRSSGEDHGGSRQVGHRTTTSTDNQYYAEDCSGREEKSVGLLSGRKEREVPLRFIGGNAGFRGTGH